MSDDLLSRLIPGLDTRPQDRAFAGLVEGRVLRAPASEQAGLYFTIESFDAERHEWGPAPWPTRVYQYTHPHPDGLTCRVLIPQPGDRVLVGFPGGDTKNPWVVDWWPVGGYQETRV